MTPLVRFLEPRVPRWMLAPLLLAIYSATLFALILFAGRTPDSLIYIDIGR